VFTRSGESTVLLDPRNGGYFSLSDVGSRIWELCDGQHSIEDIASRIAEEFDAPLDTVLADTAELVTELETEGLLTVD
jgi:pyrroloquinoline quinone biosynthesis protein D